MVPQHHSIKSTMNHVITITIKLTMHTVTSRPPKVLIHPSVPSSYDHDLAMDILVLSWSCRCCSCLLAASRLSPRALDVLRRSVNDRINSWSFAECGELTGSNVNVNSIESLCSLIHWRQLTMSSTESFLKGGQCSLNATAFSSLRVL